MKKILGILICLVLALMSACAFGEAQDPLHDRLSRLTELNYTISEVEEGPMDPAGVDASPFVELLNEMTFEAVDAEEPEGEYVVLAFPDEGIRFDFFQANPEENLFRLVRADESVQMYRAVVPEDLGNIADLMDAWYCALLDAHGITQDVLADMPGEGWVLDSVSGQVWMDDRASLEIFLEDVDNYKVLISWGSSASETTEWVYGCAYSEEDQTLRAVHLIKDDVVTNENGEETRTPMEDKDVSAVFSLDGEGRVVIRDAGDEQLEGKAFVRVPPEETAQ